MMTVRKPEDHTVMKAFLAQLYAAQSYFQRLDFLSTNPEGKKYDSCGHELPCNPYAISDATAKAKAFYAKAQKITWSDESENAIREYINGLQESGKLQEILDWEKEKPSRYSRNPYRDVS